MAVHKTQLTIDDLLDVYATSPSGELSNNDLYGVVANNIGISRSSMDHTIPVGAAGAQHSPVKRELRWMQQTMKSLSLLERTDRGRWRITEEGRAKVRLREAVDGFQLLAFSTKYGVAVWSDCRNVFDRLDEEISLYISSPPYPIQTPRAYGGIAAREYVDWICYTLEPVIKNLRAGGSLVLNIANDVFLPGSPARSSYVERLVVALEDRFGVYKMDMQPWVNMSKPPGPVRWASITRQQLNSAWEPIYWFCNDPKRCLADNRRVLQPHTERHKQFMRSGGSKTERCNGDGAHVVRKGSYGKVTEGKIPKNVFVRGHRSASTTAYQKACDAIGLVRHGAMFPAELARFYIEFLTEKGDLVADGMSGGLTVGVEAEDLARRWICVDKIWEYLRGGMMRFEQPIPNLEFLNIGA